MPLIFGGNREGLTCVDQVFLHIATNLSRVTASFDAACEHREISSKSNEILSHRGFESLQVNAWGDQPTLEMVRLIVEWGGFCFLDKDKRGDFKVRRDTKYRTRSLCAVSR